MFPFNLHYCEYKGWQKELPFYRAMLLRIRCGWGGGGGRDPRIRQKPGDRGGGDTVLAPFFFVITIMSKTRSSKQTQAQTQSGAYLRLCQWPAEIRLQRRGGRTCKHAVETDLYLEWPFLCKNGLKWI
jgi:hypothetical protein